MVMNGLGWTLVLPDAVRSEQPHCTPRAKVRREVFAARSDRALREGTGEEGRPLDRGVTIGKAVSGDLAYVGAPFECDPSVPRRRTLPRK